MAHSDRSVFNALDFVRILTDAGVPREVADAHARGLMEAMNQFVATRMDLEVMGAENRQHFGQIESDVSVIKSTLSSNENRMDGMSRHIAGIEGWGQLSAKVFIGLCVALGSAGFLTAAGYFWTNFITH